MSHYQRDPRVAPLRIPSLKHRKNHAGSGLITRVVTGGDGGGIAAPAGEPTYADFLGGPAQFFGLSEATALSRVS